MLEVLVSADGGAVTAEQLLEQVWDETPIRSPTPSRSPSCAYAETRRAAADRDGHRRRVPDSLDGADRLSTQDSSAAAACGPGSRSLAPDCSWSPARRSSPPSYTVADHSFAAGSVASQTANTRARATGRQATGHRHRPDERSCQGLPQGARRPAHGRRFPVQESLRRRRRIWCDQPTRPRPSSAAGVVARRSRRRHHRCRRLGVGNRTADPDPPAQGDQLLPDAPLKNTSTSGSTSTDRTTSSKSWQTRSTTC